MCECERVGGFPGPHCPYDPAFDFPEVFAPEDMPDSIPDAGDTPQLRRNNVDGNRRPWNGVDYAEFTEDHKRKIRAHYAALVKGIDYEVGLILEALRYKGLLDNTIIVFATDHADYLGAARSEQDACSAYSLEIEVSEPRGAEMQNSSFTDTRNLQMKSFGEVLAAIVGIAGGFGERATRKRGQAETTQRRATGRLS